MGNEMDLEKEEELRRERWKQKMADMKQQKEKRQQLNEYMRKYAGYGLGLLMAVAVIGVGSGIYLSSKANDTKELTVEQAEVEHTQVEPAVEQAKVEQTKVEQVEDTVEPQIAQGASVGQEQNVPQETEKESVGEQKVAEGGAVIAPASMETILDEQTATASTIDNRENTTVTVGDVEFWAGYETEVTDKVRGISTEDVISEYAVLIDASTGNVVAQREAQARINPASMTKILTVLVAAEHVTNWDDTFTVTLEMTDYAYVNDCSSAGFLDQETVTVKDLFYGTVLPSGGEAALALATYVAGSHEAFVEMMNEKLEELGLSDTAHFTNCVGLYDEEHYCTVTDMAMILKAAVENEKCREVLAARKYTTTATEQHPEGITISNWFLRRIEDKETGGEVLCAKTGFVNQSGSCSASYGVSDSGTPYICVTAKSTSSWKCIYDHVAIYSQYTQ